MASPYYKKNYALHWAVLLLAVGALVVPHWARTHVGVPFWTPAAATTPERVSWYFIIRMPEITTQHESGVETMKGRLTEWLTLLKSQGFHPMLLSDVLASLRDGHGLPPYTVVTIFNPGYRRTYQIVAPILERLQWPAVLLTDDIGMRHADRRFVTYHTTGLMKHSGLWDIGFVRPRGDIQLENRNGPTFHLGESTSHPWTEIEGAYARNVGYKLEGLNFLPVNSAWLAPELMNRLLVEAPPTSNPVSLAKGTIQGREWGITTTPRLGDTDTPYFDLKAPLNRRGTKLFWLGTQGANDAVIHIDCANLVGEFWVQLRVDDVTGYAIYVIYTDKTIVVVEKLPQASRRLYLGPHRSRAGNGFTGDLTLIGQRLEFSFNGDAKQTVDGLRAPVAGQGIFQTYIANKLYGTAKADGLHISFQEPPGSVK